MNNCEKNILNLFIQTIKVGPILGVCEVNDDNESVVFTTNPRYEIQFTHESYEYLKELLGGNKND